MATENERPEWPTGAGISESDAVARLASLDQGPAEAEQTTGPRERPEGDDQADPDNAQPEGGAVTEPGEGEADAPDDEGEEQAAQGEVEPPEFWSADDKEYWKTVPPELRPILKKYEAQRIEFANAKAQEAAAERAKAMEEVNKYPDTVTQAGTWWEQNGPRFVQAFGDKWGQVNWVELAGQNPAEYTRLKAMQEAEYGMLQQANARGQADIEARNKRAEEDFQRARVSEHQKVAAKLPEHFGTPEKAHKTYDDLGKFLFSKGIPAERINTIHEAPIIELALKAMLYERAQSKASAVTSSGAANTTGNVAPKRVVPGPAQPRGNRNNEAIRQVGERFKRSGDISDATELIRLRGL